MLKQCDFAPQSVSVTHYFLPISFSLKLLSMIRGICSSSELYFSYAAFLQWHLRIEYNSPAHEKMCSFTFHYIFP